MTQAKVWIVRSFTDHDAETQQFPYLADAISWGKAEHDKGKSVELYEARPVTLSFAKPPLERICPGCGGFPAAEGGYRHITENCPNHE